MVLATEKNYYCRRDHQYYIFNLMYSNRDSISFRYTLPLYSDVQLQVIRETIDILDSDCYTTV